jgi:hypothetical protein
MESYQHTQLRVKLARKGVSQIAINDLFRNFSLQEIENAPSRINAIYNLLNENGNADTFQLIRTLIEFMLANRDCQDFSIRVINGHKFIIGVN